MNERGRETGTPLYSWWKLRLGKTVLEYNLADFLKCKTHMLFDLQKSILQK